MAEFMTGMKRTDYCGDLRIGDVGREVTVCGWVQRCRDLGQLIFIDLRDRTGIVQLAFNDKTDKEIFDKAFSCRSEFVLAAKGVVCERSSKNSEIPTGDIEVVVSDMRVLSKAQTPPFEIVDDTNTNEELRLKYRYLDLRRRPLLNNLMMRSKIAKVARDYFHDNGFVEIETPMMIKSTPEGARDYLVPSRIHNGKFYALPQSPQIYKQLLMLSGFDRYIQLARCFRDEDLRADRQPEFTQIDMELSFVDVDEILEINEGFFKKLFKEVLNIDLEEHFQRMTYKEAMESYGSDKPDIRFDMKIQDISDLVKDCGFSVFTSAIENGGSVRAIVAKNASSVYTRKEIDKLTEYAKGIGAKGLAYVRWVDEPNASFKKFMSEEELSAIYERLGAEKGDVILIVADKNSTVLSTLGALRLVVAKRLDIIPDVFKFLWIVDFPFFEYDEESGETFQYCYENGIRDYLAELNGENGLTAVHYLQTETKGRDREDKPEYRLKFEAAFCFNNHVNVLEYYHNSSFLEYGGSPDKAVRNAFVFAIDKYLKSNSLYKKDEKKITFADVEESLILVINSFSTVTSYENQTKKSITNKFIQEAMTEFFRRQMEIYCGTGACE